MKFKLDKIFGAFRKTPDLESNSNDDNYIKDIINSIDDDPFAVSEQNVLFARTSELGGYFYVITIIVGSFKIKTNKGAKFAIKGNDFDLVLNSDTDEFESDHSNLSNRFVTRIDFQIEKGDVSKFDKAVIKSLKLSTKKQEILFNTIS